MCDPRADASDEQLASQARVGCRDCFARLYERYRMSLARYVFEAFVHDFDTALDLESETWKRAFEHLPSWSGERPFKSWLLAIARNHAINHLRHVRRAPDSRTLARLMQARSSGQPEREEALERCVRLVRNLPPELREPFFLRVVFDLDVKGVAELLGISSTTARGRLFRARKWLVEARSGVKP